MSEDQTEETVINASPSPIEPVEEKPKKPRNVNYLIKITIKIFRSNSYR